MIDLTTITTPFGLLDRETQEALRAHGGPYEYWNGGSWSNSASETLHDIDTALTYRAKPAPPKPREWWITIYDGMAWDDEQSAETHNHGFKELAGAIVHVREVLP